MSFAQKTVVAVLRGGPSSEYSVSLKTGDAVLQSLPANYQGLDVLISLDGDWYVGGIKKSPADILRHVDVAFIAMHGQYGEDGKLQRILEQMNIPFTGSKSLASAIAMNKHLAKEAVAKLGDKVKLASHKVFSKKDLESQTAREVFRQIPHPSVVKPIGAGSSVGVSIVKEYFDLENALELAFQHADSVIIEEFIEGKDATCGVVDDFRSEKHYALLPVEIIPAKTSAFFDYEAKYGGGSVEICPGNFDDATKRAIQEAAKAVHDGLGLRHYSRSDFIVHPKRGVYFLEVNTLPTLMAESLFLKSINAVGSNMSEFLDHVLKLARAGK